MNLRIKTILLLLATFAAYVATRSLWLDEWDCVQFALALDEFNLWKHQPHPPGYPVFIFAGRLLQALGFEPAPALILVACLAGAVFVSAWFRIVELEFGEPLGWLVALSTAVTPAVWLTATKALTDVPAAAGLSVMIWYALLFRRRQHLRDLAGMALCGALATGLRPQWLGVILLVLVSALILARVRAPRWGLALAIFLSGQLLWLVPTCWSQASAEPHRAGLRAYPQQLMRQWQWRLDKPNVYIGAGGFELQRVQERLAQHAGGWLQLGLGLRTPGKRTAFYLIFITGLGLTLARNPHRTFWASHAPWALLLAVTVFCCLPQDRRYYLALAPLMWIALFAGWSTLPRGWRWAAWLVPLRLCWSTLPIAVAGHRETPAPVQMIQAIREHQGSADTRRIVLLLQESKRHGDWYARDFDVRFARPDAASKRRVRRAAGLYTDRPDFPLQGAFAECLLHPAATFHRDPRIYVKHSEVELFQILRPGEVPIPVK